MRRAWIVQEVLAAKDLIFICGDWELPTEVVESAIIGSTLYPSLHPFGGLDHNCMDIRNEGLLQFFRIMIMRDGRTQVSDRELIDVLFLPLGTKAFDRRDHIYGVLGLSREAEEPTLRPNYLESWQHTYRRFAEYFIKHDRGLHVLHKVSSDTGSHYKIDGELPSWVPDWSYNGKLRLLLINGGVNNPDGRAASGCEMPSI